MAKPSTDAQLVTAARDGSLSAFEALVLRYQDRLYRQAIGYTRDGEEAQDAVQDTLLRAFEQLASLREPARFQAWVGQMLRRICLNRLRSNRHRRNLAAELRADHRERLEQPAGGDAALARLLARLPALSARAFALHYLEGYSLQEVAHQLHTTPGGVKQRLYRARQKLQEEMTRMAKSDDDKFDLPDGFAARTIARLLQEGARDRLYMRMEKARECFREALEVAPEDPAALMELGRTYDPITGPTAAETATLRRAQAAAPASVAVAAELPVALAEDPDQQAEAVERCLALCQRRLAAAPDDPSALVASARMYFWRADFTQMERDARAAVALTPDSQEGLNYLALALARQGRWDEAYPVYAAICAVDAKTVWAYFALRQMGTHLGFRQGDWAGAVGMQERVWALTRRPNEAGNLIYFYGKAGMIDKARALFERVKDHRHPQRVYEVVGQPRPQELDQRP